MHNFFNNVTAVTLLIYCTTYYFVYSSLAGGGGGGGSRPNIAIPFGAQKLEWCGYPMVKKV